jgi:hypothetical protein
MKRRMIEARASGLSTRKDEVFELVAHPLHAHPPCKRREDVHRLARLLRCFSGGIAGWCACCAAGRRA